MKTSNVITNIKRTISIASWPFALSSIGGVIAAIGNTIILIIGSSLITEITRQATSEIYDINKILQLLLYLSLAVPVYFIGMGSNLSGGQYATKNFKTHIIETSLHHHEQNIKDGHTAAIMSVFTNDAETIDDFFFQSLNYVIIHPIIQGGIAIVLLLTQNLLLALISIAIGIISVFVTTRFSKKVQAADFEAREANEVATKTLSEIIANDDMIRMLGIKESITNKYDIENNVYADKMIEAESLKEKMKAWNEIFTAISRTIFLGVGIYLFANGSMDFGVIFILIPLQSLVSNLFSSLATTWNYLVQVSNASTRVFNILDMPKESMREEEHDLTYHDTNPLIRFENIDFSYSDHQKLFDNFNLDITPNSTTAFVGESGSGKSTLFQLLLGFYEASHGTITIGNENIYSCNLESIRKQMVYIEQSAPLFSKTIKENIALGAQRDIEEVSMEEIIEAAKKANIHDFIMGLENGYESEIADNANMISGGQRQRIAIARAFMSPAPIIVMDEPTSALDNESEEHIQQSLDVLKKNKTVLIAAHRLSTIEDADQIVVLSKGKIQEQGTHSQLLENKQYYYKLCQSQSN